MFDAEDNHLFLCFVTFVVLGSIFFLGSEDNSRKYVLPFNEKHNQNIINLSRNVSFTECVISYLVYLCNACGKTIKSVVTSFSIAIDDNSRCTYWLIMGQVLFSR